MYTTDLVDFSDIYYLFIYLFIYFLENFLALQTP